MSCCDDIVIEVIEQPTLVTVDVLPPASIDITAVVAPVDVTVNVTEVPDDIQVNVTSVVDEIEVIAYAPGAPPAPVIDPSFQIATEIHTGFKSAFSTGYREFTYAANVITAIDIWSTAAKTRKLYEKRFTYTGSDLTGVATEDLLSSKTLTKTLTYLGGNVDTITETLA